MLTTKPLSFFRADPGQPRKSFAENDLCQLGQSMKSLGQLQPVGARPDGTLLWGERRFRAAQLIGLPQLAVIITDRPLSDTEIRLIQLAENLHRADLSAWEKYQSCAEILSGNPTWQLKELAEAIHLDASTVTRIMSAGKCSPAWQAALRDGKVTISDCYAASKLPLGEQDGLLALKLSGASRDDLEREGRKRRNGQVEAPKAAKVNCVLPGGVKVVVSGDGVSLDQAIEALGDAIKEMKRARDMGFTAKTFAAAMKDKSMRG